MDSKCPELTANEADRLEVLATYDLLDTPPEQSFDDIVSLASRLLGTPMAVLTLVDDERQWFKASIGMPMRETERGSAFCACAMLERDWMAINDTHLNHRFADNALVKGEPFIRAYAGVPLRSPQGFALGALAVMDRQPRTFAANARDDLLMLARQAMAHFEMRRQKVAGELSQGRNRLVVRALAAGVWEWSPATDETVFSSRFKEILGYSDETHPDSAAFHREGIHPDDYERVMSALARAYRSGDAFDMEYRARRADGSYLWIHSHGLTERDAEGRPLRVVGSIIDVSRRREVEEELRRSEARYRGLFEANPHPMWVYDLETLRFLTVNEAAIAHYRYTREEFLAMTVKDIRPLEDVPRLLECQKGPFEGVDTSIWRHRRRDGSLIDVEVTAHSIDFQGRKARLVLAHDITARLAAEQSLRLSEERFKLVARATRDVLWDWDLETGRTWWNASIESIFGHRPAEIEEKKEAWDSRIHPDDRERVEAGVAAFIESNETNWSDAYRVRRADETYAFVLDRGFAIRNAAGKAIRMVGSITDLTERLETEARLREQTALLDQTQDAILVCGLGRAISYWNRGAERLYGWSAAEAFGLTLEDISGRDFRRCAGVFEQVLASGEWGGDLNQIRKDRSEFAVESRWNLLCDPSGKPEAVLIVNTDVTEKRKFEAQHLRAQRVEAIGTLAGGIAHDLNNVLAPILMSIGLLRTRTPDPDDQRVLRTIEASAKRGADMVKQVLTFARGVEGENIPVSPKHLFDTIEDTFWESFPKSIRLRVNVAADLWSIVGDPTQLHQVLLNLCINARDAMPAGGDLTLAAENLRIDSHYAEMSQEVRAGPHVVITVTDTGCGIPKALLPKIFDPFFTTKDQGKGTGLGLATVMSIMRGHKGFIRLYTEEGVGTTFKLHFPADEQVASPCSEQIATHLPRGNGELVLVVDDEAAVRLVTQQTLEVFGYRVILACHGVEALAVYAEHRDEIAVVLTDMMMPVMDGPATIRALMSINPKVRIIGASGLTTNMETAKAAGAGVTHFLPKPYTAAELLHAVHDMIVDEPPV